MTDLARLLRKRLDSVTGELDEVKKEAEAVNAKLADLSKKVDSFRAALNVELGDGASTAQMESPGNSEIESEAAGDNKSQIARDLIQANRERGTTPQDLRDAFRKSGLSFHVNYPYSVLRRLRKNHTIRKSGGRYYPA